MDDLKKAWDESLKAEEKFKTILQNFVGYKMKKNRYMKGK